MKRINNGFTLIELVVTVAVLGILLGVAIPSFQETMLSSSTTQQANSLVGDMGLARSEAAKTAQTVLVEAIGGDWNDGWVVAVDVNANGIFNAGVDTVVRSHQALEDGFTVTAVDGAATTITSISFDATGALLLPATRATINLCRPDNNTTKSKTITVETTGRAASRGGASC